MIRRSEYFFSFDDKFEIHDDIEILKRMGLLLGEYEQKPFDRKEKIILTKNFVFEIIAGEKIDKGECTYDDIQRAKSMVPKSFQRYIERKFRTEEAL